MPAIPGFDSRAVYTSLIALVALERLIELRIASRNTARALSRGGIEDGRTNYAVMVVMHAAFLFSCAAEVWLLDRPWMPALGLPSVVLIALAAGLRFWVVRSLHGRWTTRVVYVPGDPLVTTGPFRYARHPNYVAVTIEVAALPLVHGAWLTALVFSAANAVVLADRIRIENRLLKRLAAPGTRGQGRGAAS